MKFSKKKDFYDDVKGNLLRLKEGQNQKSEMKNSVSDLEKVPSENEKVPEENLFYELYY